MNEAKIIEKNLHLLQSSGSEFTDACFNDYMNSDIMCNEITSNRQVFDFGLEVSDAILDYKINYEQYQHEH